MLRLKLKNIETNFNLYEKSFENMVTIAIFYFFLLFLLQ